ncbi:MAG TPA: phospholipid carrier-dependent glycosyltransferase [bacterium]
MSSTAPVKRASLVWLFGFILLYSALVIPRIFTESPTNDEPIDITNGYFYWQGDVVSHHRHPPLSELLQALPLRLLPLNTQVGPLTPDFLARAYNFFFILNRDRFELMTQLARFMTLLMGIGIGCLLFFLTRKGPRPILLMTMVLWAFESNLLAFSGLAVADVPVAFFFLAAVLAFQKHLENPGRKWALIAGGLAGMAVTCKFSALVLIPIFAILEWREFRRVKNLTKAFPQKAADWAWGTVVFLTWICVLYLPGTLLLADHRAPWSYFLQGLLDMMNYSNAHHPSFFLGVASRQNHWLYYPAAFILKSAIPFLILVTLGVLGGAKRKTHIPGWVWVPALLGFLVIIPVQNLGIRYLLPVYPFLILIASQAAGELWKRKFSRGTKIGKLLVIGLGLWQATSVLMNYPYMISYFNDLVSRNEKIYDLGDSNLDLSQDLKRLGQTGAERGWKRVKLAQYGLIDPAFYGLRWEPWTEKDLKGPQPGFVYAVNASFLQLAPVFYPNLIPIASGWLTNMPPTGRVGDTWLYFEIPGDPLPDSSQPLPSVQTLKNHAPKN